MGRWSALAHETLLAEGMVGGHLDLFFVDREPMGELNRQHLGQDRPTDVLSFPLDGPGLASAPESLGDSMEAKVGVDGPPPHLGDVVVCPDVAREQAAGHAGSVEAELALLVIHGVLHVLGHDHVAPEETVEMQSRERHHLARAGFAHPVMVR
ncbi:MAG: rRNA maturation RNase YbeY [Actinomycetia bacterium]|nr:rRNA maturation RNase YbeY [Actinomycetes bacterium]MCP4223987.1 rRNA maturation RNase YbeY [Actinomycetes bacterium]MCP5031231.1 rRNA maturation RNase YbeY [Actinomycetes bacterium]